MFMAKATKKITARFYQTKSGNSPVTDFIRSLSEADRKIVGQDLATVEYRWPLGMPTVRSMGSGLHEIRSNISDKRIVRLLFGIDGGEINIVHGFIKKTQNTPKDCLDLAIKRLGEK